MSPDDEQKIQTINQTGSQESKNHAHKVQMMSMEMTIAELKRRERIAIRIAAGMASVARFVISSDGAVTFSPHPDESAFAAVMMADALIKRLDAPPAAP